MAQSAQAVDTKVIAGKFDINAKRTAKKMENIEDGNYIFAVRSFRLYTDDKDEEVLFINLATDEAPGLVPSLRYNVSTQQGLAWLDDFIATVAGEGDVELIDVQGMQFSASKITTEDGYHNVVSPKALK